MINSEFNVFVFIASRKVVLFVISSGSVKKWQWSLRQLSLQHPCSLSVWTDEQECRKSCCVITSLFQPLMVNFVHCSLLNVCHLDEETESFSDINGFIFHEKLLSNCNLNFKNVIFSTFTSQLIILQFFIMNKTKYCLSYHDAALLSNMAELELEAVVFYQWSTGLLAAKVNIESSMTNVAKRIEPENRWPSIWENKIVINSGIGQLKVAHCGPRFKNNLNASFSNQMEISSYELIWTKHSSVFLHLRIERKIVYWNRLMLSFLLCPNISFFDVIRVVS